MTNQTNTVDAEKREALIGATSQTHSCSSLSKDTFFEIVAASSQYNMAIVEYVNNGGNADVTHKHWHEFTIYGTDNG